MAAIGNMAKAPFALMKFAGNLMKARGVRQTLQAHIAKNGPAHFQEEHYHHWYCQWVPSEKTDCWVDENLPISRKDFTEYMITKQDVDKLTQPALITFAGGGLPLVLGLPFWCNAPYKLPSTFFSTEQQIREAGQMRDQEVHIKYAGACGHNHQRMLEFWAAMDPKYNDAFDSIANGFTGKKDAKAIRRFGQFAGRVGTCAIPYERMDVGGWWRSTDHFQASLFLGKPFWGMSLRALTARLVEHYRDLAQEDKLIQKEGISSLSDFELYEICNRRLVARWEEDLNRAQLESRFDGWCTLTEIKPGSDYVPIRVILCYQAAHFRDPGFLDANLSDLDEDCWPQSWNWAKDAFERRLEFENGPLALQVQAHVANLQAEEKKYLASQ